MKVSDWLKKSTQKLDTAGIETARLDCLVLLEDVLGIDRAQILAEPSRQVSEEQQAKLNKLLNRRASHEPLAYIRRHAEFYGRRFVVNSDVLVPRPETEAMIDLLKSLFTKIDSSDSESLNIAKKSIQAKKTVNIADVGTGCGAIGITASEELKSRSNIHVELIDISQNALEVAKTNVIEYTTPIATLHSDLIASTTSDYDILLCNLPYVPNDYVVNTSAEFEPKIALYAGPDGLDLYRKLFTQLSERPDVPLLLLTEALPTQHEALAELAGQNSYKLVKTDDFIQLFIAN